jgi:chaperonin GroES
MLKPLNDKIVFEEVEIEQTTASGIIVQGNPNGEIKRGRVLSVGNKVNDVKEGDLLLVDWQYASKSKFEDKTIFVIKEENVIAVVEPN